MSPVLSLPPGVPLQFDPGLRLWVLPRAEPAEELLRHPACCLCESSLLVSTLSSVPAAGGACLPRGEPHREVERMIAAVLDGVSPYEVREAARQASTSLATPSAALGDEEALRDLARLLPAHVLGRLVGANAGQLAGLEEQAGRCSTAGDTDAPLGLAPSGARELLGIMHAIVERPDIASHRNGPLGRLADLASRRPGVALELALLRLAQLFYLVHKAAATLLRHTLHAVRELPRIRELATREPALLASLVREVRRRAPPLRHVFRVVGREFAVGDHVLRAGDALIAMYPLGKPAPTPALPPTFMPDRKSAKVFAFGAEPFASPGQMLAETIATEAAAGLLRAGFALDGPAGLQPLLQGGHPSAAPRHF